MHRCNIDRTRISHRKQKYASADHPWQIARLRPDKSPIIQNTMPRKRLSGATDNIKVINAPQPDATITPVSNNTRRAAIAAATSTEITIGEAEKSKATASAPPNAARSTIQNAP
jgi:hypothetical protein